MQLIIHIYINLEVILLNCQPGLGLEAIKGYQFVFQISSDEVARYNIVDSGSLMFFYNENEDKWVMYYDFIKFYRGNKDE